MSLSGTQEREIWRLTPHILSVPEQLCPLFFDQLLALRELFPVNCLSWLVDPAACVTTGCEDASDPDSTACLHVDCSEPVCPSRLHAIPHPFRTPT
jgi:hypothetical protein